MTDNFDKFTWTDVDEIALSLLDAHPEVDPASVRFTELKKLVQGLEGFEEQAGRPVNEKILEAIQSAWIEEKEDADAFEADDDADDDDLGDDEDDEDDDD